MKGKLISHAAVIFTITLAVFAGAFGSQRAAQAQVSKPENVIYKEVDGRKIQLEVYQPAASDVPLAAVILIHGGAGSYGDTIDMRVASQQLAAAGYVAFNINYRLLGGNHNPWPTQLEDAQQAVRWVRANAATYNVDPERICSLGHSFGGQLASQLGVRDTSADSNIELAEYSSKVACVVDIAGSVDPIGNPLINDAAGLDASLYGGKPDAVPDVYHDASALAHVSADSAPFLIFHGADDEVVPVEASRLMVDALHEAGVEVVYVEYPHAMHFDWLLADGWEDMYGPETLAFLGRHLKAAS